MDQKTMKINLKRFERKVINFYPYRTACIDQIFLEIENEDLWIYVKKFLEQNGYQINNHVCWTLDNGISAMYSDSRLMFGTEIIVKNW